MWKLLAAAGAGRALLLLEAKKGEEITWSKVVGTLLYEPFLILAFAFAGWHIFAAIESENWRISAMIFLAWGGQRGLEATLSRFLPTKGNGGPST